MTDKSDLTQVPRFVIRRRAEVEQIAATLVGHLKADPGTVLAMKAVLADWGANGACAALDRYPKEVHDWIRELAEWALTYLSLEALEHLADDAKTESEASG